MVGQPHAYRRRELIEPDWWRLPGWARVTPGEWESAQWQRAHCVKNARQLRDGAGARSLTGSVQLAGAAQRRGQRLADRLDQPRHLVGHQVGIAVRGGEYRQG